MLEESIEKDTEANVGSGLNDATYEARVQPLYVAELQIVADSTAIL
ncbi:hypothetical protein [Iningainema tapete]|uniref:Uncharacterized protein n=1 Tax=Iningainema tapete BLCC-T55 TaxID=2748662 RepID=A0A8J6XMJ4_9CYAN|nr:hypothetical protein [Iningainema tapete]MBD2773706.1 hypothetical protein [Iningainema tapete BLCC-T55]